MKVISNLFHCNGLSLTGLSFSTISAVFERVEVWLHELLISYFIFLRNKTITPPQDNNFIISLNILRTYLLKTAYILSLRGCLSESFILNFE